METMKATDQIPAVLCAVGLCHAPCEALNGKEENGKGNGSYGWQIIELREKLAYVGGETSRHCDALGEVVTCGQEHLVLLLETQHTAVWECPKPIDSQGKN